MNTEQEIDVYGRLDVTVPEAVYEAGKISTVTILLRNPFDQPVEILEIQGPRSSHVREVSKGYRISENEKISVSPQSRRKLSWFQLLLQRIAKISITEVAFSGIRAEFPATSQELNINAHPNSEIEIDTNLGEYDSVNINLQDGAKLRFTPHIQDKVSDEKTTMVIEPHCEAVAYFQISTEGWLFFTPTRRSLSSLVRYRVNGREKTQVVGSEFDIRPPLLSMIIGSVVGSLLGTLAKVFNSTQVLEWQPLIVSLGASVVMSLIATIALSRKTGTQGFITVEDFFGGFVIGALIGYGGSTYFERALIPQSTNSTTTE